MLESHRIAHDLDTAAGRTLDSLDQFRWLLAEHWPGHPVGVLGMFSSWQGEPVAGVIEAIQRDRKEWERQDHVTPSRTDKLPPRKSRTVVCCYCGKREVPEDNECGGCGVQRERKGVA